MSITFTSSTPQDPITVYQELIIENTTSAYNNASNIKTLSNKVKILELKSKQQEILQKIDARRAVGKSNLERELNEQPFFVRWALTPFKSGILRRADQVCNEDLVNKFNDIGQKLQKLEEKCTKSR